MVGHTCSLGSDEYNQVLSERRATAVRDYLESQGVDVKLYSIIYELIDDVKAAMEGKLDPIVKEEVLGRAQVRDLFTVPKMGTIAGSHVTDGKITRNSNVRLIRDDVVVFSGKLSSLKRFKDDVKEVKNGFECGMGIENYQDIKIGDVIEAYQNVESKASLEFSEGV